MTNFITDSRLKMYFFYRLLTISYPKKFRKIKFIGFGLGSRSVFESLELGHFLY